MGGPSVHRLYRRISCGDSQNTPRSRKTCAVALLVSATDMLSYNVSHTIVIAGGMVPFARQAAS